ncbi:(2Fe-2S)-binding protein [Geodermatophilus sp. SYSU D00697]
MSRPAWATARRPPAEATFRLRVNGREAEVTCRGDAPLLYLLRNDLGLRGSRFGCGLAQCGACMVLLDGHPTPSCDLPVEAAQGHDVVTVEGLAEDPVMQALRRSFLDLQAAQCGYCTSGILVSACALLRDEAAPARPAVAGALERNLCRCGSHGRVLRAVEQAATALADDRPAGDPASSTTDHGRDDP